MTGPADASVLTVLGSPAMGSRAANPYTWLLYTHLNELGVRVEDFDRSRLVHRRADVWHLHWPDTVMNHPTAAGAFAASRLLLAYLDLARARGVAAVWTVHNLSVHDSRHPRIEAWFWPAFTRRLRGFIALSDSGRNAVVERHPHLARLPGPVVPHGHYRGAYPDTVERAGARSRVGLTDGCPVILFIGRIRGYKGLPELITAFHELAGPATLLVVGEPADDRVAADLALAASRDNRIRLVLRFVPDEDLQLYLRAADLVVLPYERFLNSGTALLALSFDAPVLVSDSPTMRDLEHEVGPHWLRRFGSRLGSADLGAAVAWARAPREPRPDLSRFNWDGLAEQTLAAYRAVIASSTGR